MFNYCFDITNVSLSYKFNKILKDISFSIPKGKFTAIIGPNGSGKSTLLSCLTGELTPDKGEVYFDKQNIRDIYSKERALRMAIVHQENTGVNGFTVREIVLMGRTPYRKFGYQDLEKDEIIVSEAIEMLGLKSFENKKIEELSGGQQQRVWLALAIAQDTEFILLDEPMNNLDIYYQLEMLNLFKEMVKKKNKTIVAILHDLNQVLQFVDYVIVLKEGNILKTGNPIEVLTPNLVKNLFLVNSQIISGRHNPVLDFYLGG
ncbi:iron complex transport system ATP-binding protein [Enterococcus sp. DIV0421]|uniref:ABC transporter ATP-binding protein n=1 Tax=Enterococcus sp. DIV0421 TaxID=2774688 RepID=UPI003F256AC2